MSFSSDNPLLVNQLPISFDLPDEPREQKNELLLWIKRVADSVNRKEGSVYTLSESASFKQYPNTGNPQQFNSVYRKTFDLRSLNGNVDIPGGATIGPFPTDITGMTQVAISYVGCTDDSGDTFSVMYPYLIFNINAKTITFTNPSAQPLTRATAVVDYLKT